MLKWTANEIKSPDADSLSDAIEENKVLKVPILLFFLAILAGCETLYQNEGISRINSQRDVDAYNATVSAESDMLVCTREQVLGSNIREFVCLTVAQRERLRQAAVEDLEFLNQELNRTGSAA
ncbi:MAG: hypothetical protein NZ837_11455, partial [Gammaproteobacteria bacterium]|nr:hypothetical protein [Gammaproteobacteria bacterium]